MNAADIILLILIACALVLAVKSVIKRSKHGCCCADCRCCASRCKRLEVRDEK